MYYIRTGFQIMEIQISPAKETLVTVSALSLGAKFTSAFTRITEGNQKKSVRRTEGTTRFVNSLTSDSGARITEGKRQDSKDL